MATEFTYPYNPNGVLEECKVVDETHTITPAGDRNYNWFIPFAAPFFGFSVVVTHVTTGKTLQRGVDYNLGLEYHVFNTRVTLRPVYGAIILVDKTLTGQFKIDYMTVGGQYAINEVKALAYLANAAIDPRSTYWENVTDIPSQFPVTQHLHNVDDLVGMSELVDAVKALTVAVSDGNGKWFQSLNEHLTDYNDPHHVLEMIPGDGSGTAIPKATQQQAIEGTDNTGYMTALRTAQYASANVTPLINTHIADQNNPHGVNKQQVGLGQVVNLPFGTNGDVDGGTNPTYYASLAVAQYIAQKIVDAYNTAYLQAMATQSDAEGATENTHWMTSLRVAQQIAKTVGADLQAHINETGNVHNLTAADINLDKVANYAPTVQADVDSNTNQDDTVTTPTLVKYIVSKMLSDTGIGDYVTEAELADYLSDTSHLPMATPPVALAGIDAESLLSPLLGKLMIDDAALLISKLVVNTAEDLAACLGQSSWTSNIVDVLNVKVYRYSTENLTWSEDTTATPTTELKNGVFYVNAVSSKLFQCTDSAGSAEPVIDAGSNVTVSNTAPPSDTSAYKPGHVWYQVS